MARADPDLLKPSMYALGAGLAASLICLIPLVLAILFLGNTLGGQILAGVLGAALVFAQLLIGYIFSAMTAYLVDEYLRQGDGRMSHAWAIVRRDWLDLVSLAVASTVISLVRSMLQGNRKSSGRNLLGNSLGALWTEATYLILPAMVLEDLNLKDGLARTARIVGDNLILMGISLVGVRSVNALLGFGLSAIGAGLGLIAGIGVSGWSHGSAVGVSLGIGAGVLIASVFVLAAIALSAYTSTAYHTCLFLWAREVERSRQPDQNVTAAPPAPLAAALASLNSISAPIYS